MEDEKRLRDIIREEIGAALTDHHIKIDVNDIVDQLRKPPASNSVRAYLNGEDRFVALFRERSRRAARDTYDFIDKEMRDALFHPNQFAVLGDRKDQIAKPGTNIVDLGVYKGGSTRALAKMFPDYTIHGFDSFEGLPEDWSHAIKGSFGEIQGALPDMPGNVKLYKGWFDQTLPVWAREHAGTPISLLRVDCDIYSSTKTIFDELGQFVESGTWICFDELIGYYGFADHEHKAFMEFIARTGFKYKYVAYGLTYTIARIL